MMSGPPIRTCQTDATNQVKGVRSQSESRNERAEATRRVVIASQSISKSPIDLDYHVTTVIALEFRRAAVAVISEGVPATGRRERGP